MFKTLKLDLLGLETNLIIKNTLNSLPEKIDVNTINLEDDPIIYDQFQNGNLLPYGLYQISADCAYKVCKYLKPKNVMELSHVNAIARPTALAYEKPYIKNESKCPHPLLEKALNWTHYQPLYQEQTLLCLKAIGFDDVEAEMARRVWAKKKIDEVDIQLNKVKEKLEKNKLPKEVGDIVIKLAEEGANYQFNLSHSLSTSYLTALTVYLKYKYPLQFYQACLNEAKNKSDFTERLSQINSELPQFGIKLLPPHLIKSDTSFKIENVIYVFPCPAAEGNPNHIITFD
jgi:DNA polymerase-3 subunit alpha